MRAEITGDPLLSIVITSYTMESFKDICDLFDSIKSQTILNPTQQTQGTQQTGANFKVLWNEAKQSLSATKNNSNLIGK
ncbi:MAG: hypothetical protein CO103_06775 [Chloroflexi bacterium CG_4_9_14_3_um_filter_45_9]|nr:MAG: hypothetical protein COZ67_00725 [Chloroflexi bacterium CG_4_8_14_3_um_filter_45_15]PJB49004.1 MAG: hypothetical protein CO103_06775 [Chloroflexi bacterium CG_4_9_14_3_um_filter_45_9]